MDEMKVKTKSGNELKFWYDDDDDVWKLDDLSGVGSYSFNDIDEATECFLFINPLGNVEDNMAYVPYDEVPTDYLKHLYEQESSVVKENREDIRKIVKSRSD